MGSRWVFIASFGFGLGLSSLMGTVFAQPSGYVNSQMGCPRPHSVNLLDGAFGPINGGADSEFGYLVASDPYKEWPVCGPGSTATNPKTSPRIPVAEDGTVSTAATTGLPNAVDTTTGVPAYWYVWANSPTSPVYAYRRMGGGRNRCACLSDMITAPAAPPTFTASPTRQSPTEYSTSTLRFHPSTFEDISNATSNYPPPKPYGPVAVSTKISGDPRAFSRFHPGAGPTDYSVCSCPNINESARQIIPGDSHSGSVCEPMISDTPTGVRVLAPYGESAALSTYYHNPPNGSHILTAWKEQAAASTPLSGTVNLPTESDLSVVERYYRRIWTCSAPYEPNLATGTCGHNRQKHACGEGSGAIALSPYGEVSDTASNLNFQKLANKKLACCLNSHAVSDAGVTQQNFLKYDCLQTKEVDASGARLDFNALWAGGDDIQDGGQMNALALVSAVGQPITGFYTLRGTRCGRFSEFGGELRPKRVQPFLVANQQASVSGGATIENLGNAYPLPSGLAYTNFSASISKLVPNSMQEMNECPILVRAALVVACPSSNPGILPDLRFQDPTDSSLIRCPMATSVTVHVRIEQLYQIAGQSPLKTFDTRAMRDQVGSLDVADIIANRFGDTCLPGTRKVGDVCTY